MHAIRSIKVSRGSNAVVRFQCVLFDAVAYHYGISTGLAVPQAILQQQARYSYSIGVLDHWPRLVSQGASKQNAAVQTTHNNFAIPTECDLHKTPSGASTGTETVTIGALNTCICRIKTVVCPP